MLEVDLMMNKGGLKLISNPLLRHVNASFISRKGNTSALELHGLDYGRRNRSIVSRILVGCSFRLKRNIGLVEAFFARQHATTFNRPISLSASLKTSKNEWGAAEPRYLQSVLRIKHNSRKIFSIENRSTETKFIQAT
jgi:hypothetical protein